MCPRFLVLGIHARTLLHAMELARILEPQVINAPHGKAEDVHAHRP